MISKEQWQKESWQGESDIFWLWKKCQVLHKDSNGIEFWALPWEM